MYHPTTRVLTVLEFLQSQPEITGAEIARRLDVDVRTARRYIAMLEDLGVPITAERGRRGGYRLMPGFKLPPLMFHDDEALAVTLGLLAARRLGLASHAPGVEGALAKLERVLPERLRPQVRAVEETIVWDLGGRSGPGPESAIVLALTRATQDHRRVTLDYRSADGALTERSFDPYGLVCRRAYWYTIGHCHLRGGQRLFRLDRVAEVTLLDDTFSVPPGFDVLASVLQALGSVPRELAIEVALDTTLNHARHYISANIATLDETPDGGVLLRGYTDNADWMARLLASIGCRLEIRRPPELREALRRHAAQLAEWAAAQPDT